MKVRRARRRGVAAVECALMLPLVMTIVMGVIESGRMTLAQGVIANASREGARLAVLGGTTIGTDTSTGSNEVKYLVRTYLDGGSVASSAATITVTDLDYNGMTDLPQSAVGDRIQISVSVPFSSIAWCTPWFFGTSTLKQISIMRKEAL